jgi:very-short-patch-repair endonuclease
VYSLVPPSLLTREGHWLAAVLACGDGAVLSIRTAAALQGLRPTSRAKIDVTIPGRSHRSHPGIDVHRSTTLTEADVTVVNGIPCTTVARTLFDLADVIRRRPLERAFDHADAQGTLNMLEIEDQLRRNATRPAAAKIRALLAEHYVGTTLTRSDLEESVLVGARSRGLPAPVVNELLVLPDGGPPIRVDFLFSEARVAVESDGHNTHRTRQQFELDRENDQRLTLFGYRPVRTTWRQIERRLDVFLDRLVVIIQGPPFRP